MFKRITMAALAAAALAAQAIPAAACGGLVAPNGAIRLSRRQHPGRLARRR